MPDEIPFEPTFRALMGSPPFPWQVELYRRLGAGDWSRLTACDIPTGLGKTAIIPTWLIAQANRCDVIPRRLVYVVNRRTVVDQATDEAVRLRGLLQSPESDDPAPEVAMLRWRLARALSDLAALPSAIPLAISTLRGQFADNREWSSDPARPAIIVGTVDMIGSRLLFNGYGLGFKTRPLHAGFLGYDALLVHDEAHLEPAFQRLIESVRAEQDREPARLGEGKRLRVMALTATPRGGDALRITEDDCGNPEVKKRVEARKSIELHECDHEKNLPKRLAELALSHKDSRRNVLIFARAVGDVEQVFVLLRKEKQESVVTLTGTLRGKERDELVRTNPVFLRFRPASDGAHEQTAYLVCTSAGEVGVNISADHLVCDLSTFESMAQRFGRVNRFGEREDTRIDILYPKEIDEEDDINARRAKTLALLRKLNHDGSPAALDRLDQNERVAAFSPDPVFLHTSDILFDAWTLTSIRDSLPGRPPVEPYLRGLTDREPPATQVAWREEVEIIKPALQERYDPKALLEAYPLKPHELLRDRSSRVFTQLVAIASRSPDSPAWLVDHDGSVQILKLKELADKEKKDRINDRTVLLPPSVGGLEGGFLRGGSAEKVVDVADEWLDEQGNRRRERRWDDESPPDGMRLILTVGAYDPEAQEGEDVEEDTSNRLWRWYIKPRSADDDMSKTAERAVALKTHTDDVVVNAQRIAQKLQVSEELRTVLTEAAALHDLGKGRRLWQKSIGNRDLDRLLAKAGTSRSRRAMDFGSDYRHEFGSLLDAEGQSRLQGLGEELRELALHLIAAHHGRGRPHFGSNEVFDPQYPQDVSDRVAAEVPQRFARLQRQFGRWGLAYLESLLRAADYAASADPSARLEEES